MKSWNTAIRTPPPPSLGHSEERGQTPSPNPRNARELVWQSPAHDLHDLLMTSQPSQAAEGVQFGGLRTAYLPFSQTMWSCRLHGTRTSSSYRISLQLGRESAPPNLRPCYSGE